MILTENEKIEKSVVAGASCIAVPIEIFVPVSGEPIITAYSLCRKEAEAFCDRFEGRLLDEDALEYLENEFSIIAENIGYKRERNENELMLEFIFKSDRHLPKNANSVKAHRISSNAVLSELCMASGCDIEIADDGNDVVYAVVENGRIAAYAGMNDVFYDDNSVEISVETAPDSRRKGYGLACVHGLVDELLNKGVCVRYKCSCDNLPSLALAKKCGFELEGQRFSFVCYK